ncbi:MAG TPA: dUTP diphosphatase [Allosphingosinicella sp.]
MLKVKFKKLDEKAVTPSYALQGDAGMDLTATTKKVVDTGSYGYTEFGTGLAMEIPEGYVGLLFPRSSVSKTGHILANSIGVVDSNYRGEVMLRFKTVPHSVEYQVGERVAQIVILPVPQMEFEEVDELDNTDRGNGGFGSTGK